jgi:hypothetical protein
MRLSGPVDFVRLSFQGREWLLISDRHNSTQGSCPEICSDLNLETGLVSSQRSECETILYFLDRELRKGADFFLEASFVVKDEKRPKFLYAEADYIDRLLFLFHSSFLRNKKESTYPNSYLHYIDVRDLFIGTYNESGTREMVSANPFSGSVIVKAFQLCTSIEDCWTVYKQAKTLISFILSNSWGYFNNYLDYKGAFPTPPTESRVFEEFYQRLNRIEYLKTTYRGRTTMRIGKQLLKLSKTDATRIEEWARVRFAAELKESHRSYELWIKKMDDLFARQLPEELFFIYFNSLKTEPISCLVALSSVIMDVYALARSFYHQHKEKTIFYCGSAHIENYLSFFQQHGGRITQKSVSAGTLERCLVSL